MGLHLSIDGVSAEDKQRGIAAAEAVLRAADMTADQASAGMSALEWWDDDGCQGEMSDEDSHAASVWLEAEAAAIDACCIGWPDDKKPGIPALEYHPDGESPLH